MTVKLVHHDFSRFGDFAEVKVHGTTVATIQGVAEEDINKAYVKRWAKAAFEGLTPAQVKDTVKYGGVMSLSPDEVAK